MDEQQKEELVARFRSYLETEFVPEPQEAFVDRMTLFNELAGLKNEVRIESRQLKGALDDFRQVFTSLDDAHADVSRMFEHVRQQDRELARAAQKPIILGLLDLYDRLSAGLAGQLPAPSLFERFLPGRQQSRKWLQVHREGQRMILDRLLELLRQCGVSAIETVGEPFDPHCMQAVGSEADPAQAHGVVLHENRKGFRQDGASLRPAEVIVNKREV